jgi:hypothetical protein
MAKIFYFIEFVVIFVLLLPLSLNYSDPGAFAIPDFGQIKNSVSIKTDVPENSNNVTDFYDNQSTSCQQHLNLRPVGFPFVNKSSDGCDHGNSYRVGLWFDYALVALTALIVTKLTSMIVSKFDKS